MVFPVVVGVATTVIGLLEDGKNLIETAKKLVGQLKVDMFTKEHVSNGKF